MRHRKGNGIALQSQCPSPSLRRVKTITSYSGVARFIAECDRVAVSPAAAESEDPDLLVLGYLARVQVEEIPSPYAYSPSVQIHRWHGKPVIWFETSHRRYEVFEVLPQLKRFKTDDEATDWHVRFSKTARA